MPTVNFNAPEEFNEKLKAYTLEHHVDNLSHFIRQAIEKAMEPETLSRDTLPGPGTPRPEPPTPAKAAEIILGLLPEGQRNLIVDVAQEHGRHPLDFILSYCKLADERGETATLIAEQVTDDEEQFKYTQGHVQSPTGQYVPCEYEGCRKPFLMVKRGQKFCPDPEEGESCGRKAALEALHKRRPQTLSPQHRLAAKAGIVA